MRLWYQTAAPYGLFLYFLLWLVCVFGAFGGFK